MKVGVISDTHDRLPPFARAVAMFRRLGCEAIFHAGDYIAPFAARLISAQAITVPVHCVYGNNDGERAGLKAVLPQLQDGPLTVRLGGRTIVMHHFIDWLKPADYAAADVVITGHTHEAAAENCGGRLFLNPGECCGWVHEVCTAAILDLDTLKSEIVQIT